MVPMETTVRGYTLGSAMLFVEDFLPGYIQGPSSLVQELKHIDLTGAPKIDSHCWQEISTAPATISCLSDRLVAF